MFSNRPIWFTNGTAFLVQDGLADYNKAMRQMHRRVTVGFGLAPRIGRQVDAVRYKPKDWNDMKASRKCSVCGMWTAGHRLAMVDGRYYCSDHVVQPRRPRRRDADFHS